MARARYGVDAPPALFGLLSGAVLLIAVAKRLPSGTVTGLWLPTLLLTATKP